MTRNKIKAIRQGLKALKLRLPLTPDNDPVHDLVDGLLTLCDEQDNTLALDILRARYMHVAGALVHRYRKDGQWIGAAIPRHQPFDEQIQWCSRKGASMVEVQISIDAPDRKTTITQSLTIQELTT